MSHNHKGLKIWSYSQLLDELNIKIVKRKISNSQHDSQSQDDHTQATHDLVARKPSTPKKTISMEQSTNGFIVLHNPKDKRTNMKYFYPSTNGHQKFNFPFIDFNTYPTESPFSTYTKHEELLNRMKKEQRVSTPTSPAKTVTVPVNAGSASKSTKTSPSKRISSTVGSTSTKGLPFCNLCNLFFDGALEDHRQDAQHQRFSMKHSNYTKIDALFGDIRADWAVKGTPNQPAKKKRKIAQSLIDELSEIIGAPSSDEEEEEEMLGPPKLDEHEKLEYAPAQGEQIKDLTWTVIKTESID
jgi:hypothetical protein